MRILKKEYYIPYIKPNDIRLNVIDTQTFTENLTKLLYTYEEMYFNQVLVQAVAGTDRR